MYLKQATNLEDAKRIAQLAETIWHAHYTPLIGADQVAYMLQALQSAEAIFSAINQGVCYFLVQDAEEDAGYVAYDMRADHCFLSKLYIAADQRGRGLGRAVLLMVKRAATLAEVGSIRLTVNKDNADTIAWYQSHGFQTVEEIVIDVGSGYVMDDYLMELSL